MYTENMNDTHIETGIPDLDKKLSGGYSTEDHPPHEHTGHMNCCGVVAIDAKYCDEESRIVFGMYEQGRTAIQIATLDSEPVYTATVNVPEAEVPDGHVLLKGWSENAGVPEALEKAGVVELTTTLVPTGHCVAHLAKLLAVVP